MGSLNNGFFFFNFYLLKKEEEDLGSDIHIVWEKRSHELVLCHSLMVDSFPGQNQAFFSSLSDCMFFLGSKLNLVWHSHVRYRWRATMGN